MLHGRSALRVDEPDCRELKIQNQGRKYRVLEEILKGWELSAQIFCSSLRGVRAQGRRAAGCYSWIITTPAPASYLVQASRPLFSEACLDESRMARV